MGETLRDVFLTASGVLAIAAGLTHAVLGEMKIFPRAEIRPNGLRLLIHAVWLFGVISWIAVAVLVIAAPHLGSPAARHWIVGTSAATFALGSIGNAVGTRGKHFGWIVLLVVVALALAGW